MFLERYKATWILTEDHSFEDRMIDDLSVSWGLLGVWEQSWIGLGLRLPVAHLQGSPFTLRGMRKVAPGLGGIRGGCKMWSM